MTWQGGGYTLARGVHVYRTTPSDDFWSNVGVWMLPRVSLLFVLSDLGSLCVCCTGGEPYPVSWCLAMASRQSRDLVCGVRFSTEFESGARETAHTFMDVCQECWEHYLL